MSWPPVLVSAPGKVILHGEHAVVYGKSALATSMDLRCFLLLLPQDDGTVVVDLPDVQLHKTWKMSDLTHCLSTEGIQMDSLRQLSGIDLGDGSPSVQSLATLAFLYLLTHIFQEKIRDLPGLQVTVISNLPASAGLGSSAAFAVCLASGLLYTLKHIGERVTEITFDSGPRPQSAVEEQPKDGSSVMDDSCADISSLPEAIMRKLQASGHHGSGILCGWSQEELEAINRWGFEAEKLIHGTPSGIDNSISTFGGAINFQSGHITALKRMPHIRILLVNTKVPRSTKKMVAGVRERYNKYPEVIGPVLSSIEAISKEAHEQLDKLAGLACSQDQDEIYSRLQELFVMNQHLLSAIGVGHPALDRVCSIAQQFGLVAKLTGGGGGGCAIALVPPGFSQTRLAEAKAALAEAGFDCWETAIGSRGVTRHLLSK